MLIDSQKLQGTIAVVTSFTKRTKWRTVVKADPAIYVAAKSLTREIGGHSTSQSATAALDGLIFDASLGVSRMQLLPSEQVCRKCYQNLEKLDKARATVSQLIATTNLVLESFCRKVSNTTDKQL